MGFWRRFRRHSAETADFDYLIGELTVRDPALPADPPPTPPPPAGEASADDSQIADSDVAQLPADFARETAEPEPPVVESDGADPGVDSRPEEDLDVGDAGRDEERLDQETGDVPWPEPGLEEARRFAQDGHETHTAAEGIHIPVDPPADLDRYDRRWDDGDLRSEQPHLERTAPRREDDVADAADDIPEASPEASPASEFDAILHDLSNEFDGLIAGADGQSGHDLD